MKKILLLLISIFIIVSACSCNFTINKKKPSTYYYTELLSKNFVQNVPYKITVFDTNLYKDKTLPNEYKTCVKNLVGYLKPNNFITSIKKLPTSPVYKIFVEFNNKEKFVINVYNKDLITIYPYDGIYNADYVNVKNIYPSYNLYTLSQYVIENLK